MLGLKTELLSMVRIEIFRLAKLTSLWDLLLFRNMWKNIYKGLTKTVDIHMQFISLKSNTKKSDERRKSKHFINNVTRGTFTFLKAAFII